MPMTSTGKRKNIKKKSINNGWVMNTNSSKKIGNVFRKTSKPQTLAEMLAYNRPSTQAGKTVKGFFKNSGNSPKAFKISNGFLRRQISQGKLTQSTKPTLNNVRSTVTIKPSQITLSPKNKDSCQNKKRMSTNMIDVESHVDNFTTTNNSSNSTDVKTRTEKDQHKQDSGNNQDYNPKRASTQAAKLRINKGSVNRIREAKRKAEMLMGKDGNNAVFQYQFEMQNKEEEN